MCVHVGVLRCQILEPSMFRKITNKIGEVNNPGKQVEPMSLNTCVISHKNVCGVKPTTNSE